MNDLDLKVSHFKDSYSSGYSKIRTKLAYVFKRIETGRLNSKDTKETIKKDIEEARKYINKDGTKNPKYDEIKVRLPSFTVAGTFGKRDKKSIQTYIKYTILDIDGVRKSGKSLVALKKEVCNIDTTLCCFISPSGDGLKIIIPIDSEKEHHEWATTRVMENYSKQLGIKIDPSGTDISRLCYYSYDPNIYVNKNAKTFEISLIPDMDTRIKTAIRLTEKKQTFKEGNRSNFIYSLSSYMNKFGVELGGACHYLIEKYGDKGFDIFEIEKIAKSAYNVKTEHGTWQNYDSKPKTVKFSELEKQRIREIEEELGIDSFKEINDELMVNILFSVFGTEEETIIFNTFFESSDLIMLELEDSTFGRLLLEMIDNKTFYLTDFLQHPNEEIKTTAKAVYAKADLKVLYKPISLQILALRYRHKKLKALFDKKMKDSIFSKKISLNEISADLKNIAEINRDCISSIHSLLAFYEEGKDKRKKS